MGIINVKAGPNLIFQADLNFDVPVEKNIQYIGKLLGIPPNKLLGDTYAPSSGLKYGLKKEDSSVIPSGTTLRRNGIQEFVPHAGEVTDNNPLPMARTVEFYEIGNPAFVPPYPQDRFGAAQVTEPVRSLPHP